MIQIGKLVVVAEGLVVREDSGRKLTDLYQTNLIHEKKKVFNHEREREYGVSKSPANKKEKKTNGGHLLLKCRTFVWVPFTPFRTASHVKDLHRLLTQMQQGFVW